MNWPYVFGQSGTASPESVLVTMPPAAMSSTVEATTSLMYRWSQVTALVALNVKLMFFVSFAPSVTLCVCVPSFSCHASIV